MSAMPNLPEEVLNNVVNGDSKQAVNGQATNGMDSNQRVTMNGNSTSSEGEAFKIYEQAVENPRPIKVIVIGAGLSGIYCGIRVPERLRNCELKIYEKNPSVGGTWYENKYPGCACDVPSHSYQYSFAPNSQWSTLYAPASEIEAYLRDVCYKHHADRFITLSHKVEDCTWDEASGKWKVTIRDLTADRVFVDTSDVVISARGGLNYISWPKIRGLNTYAGKLVHSAQWDQSYDYSNKRIGIIGNGSSGIQILPKLQKLAGTHVYSFARSPTWISPSFGEQTFERVGMRDVVIPEATKQKFSSDPDYYQRFREQVEWDQNEVHAATLIGTPMQTEGQKYFEASMRKKLENKPEVLERLLPHFPPGCRRLTPGPGYLEALNESNVDFISTDIEEITEKGVRTVDGQHREVDVLVCATGFNTDFKPPFSVYGSAGKSLHDHWTEYPDTYMAVATNDFPNMFFMLGPNAAIGAGSLILMIESAGDYAIKCIRKLQKENIRSMSAKGARVRDFVEYCDEYFKRTVYATDCKSWYKTGNRVSGLWPGSTLHCIEALRSPRWEDYEYEYEEGKDCNQLRWLGNGCSLNFEQKKHMAWFLYPEFVEVPKEWPEEHERHQIRMFSN